MTDIIVIGGGPAGMTAALYALRNGKSALILEKHGFGGQITYSPKVENWPGTAQMSGNEFADALLEQVMAQGAEVDLAEVLRVEDRGSVKAVYTDDGKVHEAKALVIATGVKHRMLGLPGENELVGEGISFCAVCDGDFYTGQTVCVAGGGNSALQEAILLSGKCAQVIMLQDLPEFTGEKKLQEILFARDNVKKYTGVKITALETEGGALRGVTVEPQSGGEKQIIACDGLFVAIGLIPENEAFRPLADLNPWGYFDSGENCETKTPGIFVAGDCRSKGVRQLTTAAGDGATAALAACRYIDAL
ncbi:MAG: FAD-dependent oxidoreductase [Clostridia bacterium]|nr:FAD-dependent oxidoreductase [Clostridia bacterium]MBR4577732.1 FAD-dependent oxidoreductase [Clostridia bacterium]